MLQSPEAFAANMMSGILCTGLACSLDTVGTSGCSANALQLDVPGWKALGALGA